MEWLKKRIPGIFILLSISTGLVFFLQPFVFSQDAPQEKSPKEEDGVVLVQGAGQAKVPQAVLAALPVDESKVLKNPFKSFLPEMSPALAGAQAPQPVAPGQVIGVPGGEGPVFDVSSLSVSGLVWGIEKAKAIINDQVYGIGDSVNGAYIQKISKEGIVFQFSGRDYFLKR